MTVSKTALFKSAELRGLEVHTGEFINNGDNVHLGKA